MILIKISHLTANIPFRQCDLRFTLRKVNPNHPGQQPQQVSLLPKAISTDLNEILKVTSSHITPGEDVMVCVIVEAKQRVHIGYILVDPYQPLIDRRSPLRGLSDQTGYIVYSVIHQSNDKREFPQNIQKKVSIPDYQQQDQRMVEKQPEIQRFSEMKRSKNKLFNVTNVKIINRGLDKNNRESSESELSEYKQKSIQKQRAINTLKSELNGMREQTEKYKEEIDRKILNYEKTIDILRHQILNQQYKTVLKDNQIFQLKYKPKIQKLIGTSNYSASN